MKKEITINGIINLKHGNYEYPISLQLIKDGRKNKVFHKKIYGKLKITMVQAAEVKSPARLMMSGLEHQGDHQRHSRQVLPQIWRDGVV